MKREKLLHNLPLHAPRNTLTCSIRPEALVQSHSFGPIDHAYVKLRLKVKR